MPHHHDGPSPASRLDHYPDAGPALYWPATRIEIDSGKAKSFSFIVGAFDRKGRYATGMRNGDALLRSVASRIEALRQQTLAFPWIGKNMLVGIIPLGIALLTWIIMRTWLKHDRASQV